MYYIQLPTGGPTQGDIWSNLPSPTGRGEYCNGLVITPRCDFAHSKSPVLNYLPIVSLENYLLSVGCFPQIEQIIRETRDTLRSKVVPLNVESLFDLDVPIDEILDQVVRSTPPSNPPQLRQFDKARTELEAGHQRIKQLTALLSKTQLSLSELRGAINNRRLSIIQRDLIKNNHADTYFLPPCDGLLEAPSLVLLRHIYTCPIGYVSTTQRSESIPERLLRLDSPFIESLMSKFASLFTRVGTRDIPDPVAQAFFLPNEATSE